MISYYPSSQSLVSLLNKMRSNRLVIPEYQREFVWSLNLQRKLVEAIRRPKPIPSILLREHEDGSFSLEDGQQRLRTLLRFIDNEFDVDGTYFKDLTKSQQDLIHLFNVVVITYSGATDEEAREIFNDHQNGKPLTFGERLYTMQHTSPIVKYAIVNLLVPGTEFYSRFTAVFGTDRTPKSQRGSAMTTAFALCAGIAFGIDKLSKKWDDANSILHKEFDVAITNAKLDLYLRIWEKVNKLSGGTNKDRAKKYWDLGNFGGYIVYSIELYNNNDYSNYNLPNTTKELIDLWADAIVNNYTDKPIGKPLLDVLHENLDKARSWKRARWSNGLRSMLGVPIDIMTDSDDDDDNV